jgi:hypothetical protein
MTTSTEIKDWRAALDASKDRTLKASADGGIVHTHAAAARMVAAWTLAPAPRDPVRHLVEVEAVAVM